MQLRDYQINAINEIRLSFAKGYKRIILCSPTGSGKTVIFSEISKLTTAKNNKVLIITDRKELLKQTNNKLNNFGLNPFLLTANEKNLQNSLCCVAMVETIKRRLEKQDYKDFIQNFNLIIIDEAHKCSFDRIFESIDNKQMVIGATATPYRNGKMKELKMYYDKIIDVTSVQNLINIGFLSSPISFGIPVDLSKIGIKGDDFDELDIEKMYSDSKLADGIVENYKKHCNNEKMLVFCATIKNSKLITDNLSLNGLNAKHFDCYMDTLERENILSWFENTENAVLCNVGILTTGFDCPSIKVVALYRPTKSLPLFLQMVGRGSRILPDKNEFKILDFGNNIGRFGFWEDDRVWTLENDKKPKKKEKQVAPVKNCPKCDALLPASVMKCKFCGFEFKSKAKDKTRIEMILERLTPSQIQNYAETCTVQELEEIRKAKGYKLGWICYKLKTLEEFKQYEKIRGFKNGWAEHNFKFISNPTPKEIISLKDTLAYNEIN